MSRDGIVGARLDHVAIAVPRIGDAVGVLVGCLGGRPDHGGPGIGFRGGQWSFARGARIEVIEPDGPPGGFLHRFLEAHGPGIHHVTFKVPDIYRAADAARAHGYDVVGFNDAFAGWKELFLHPKQAQGIVVQMAQTDPAIPDESWNPGFAFPRFEGPVPAPASVTGVRLGARSLDAARRQWSALLGGRCTEKAGELAFEWNESPLEIFVEERDQDEPCCIEIDGAPTDRTALEREAERVGTRFRFV